MQRLCRCCPITIHSLLWKKKSCSSLASPTASVCFDYHDVTLPSCVISAQCPVGHYTYCCVGWEADAVTAWNIIINWVRCVGYECEGMFLDLVSWKHCRLRFIFEKAFVCSSLCCRLEKLRLQWVVLCCRMSRLKLQHIWGNFAMLLCVHDSVLDEWCLCFSQ